jgi:phosphoglucosamine mutase
VLRYSGTEPKARVMIEGKDPEIVDELASKLAGVIEQELG